MANKIPLAYADLELQLASSISIGDTTFSLSSATDDDGNALPAGKYCITVNNGKSNKQYLMGQLNGVNMTAVATVSRQGVESSGAEYAARIGDTAIVTNFATLQRVADILRGQETADGDNPISYDAEPTLTDRKELATVAYVLDNITGGTVAFDNQVITGVNAGETVVANNLLYLKTSDQEWYKTDATTATTVNGVQLGFAKGAGSNGVAITGGVQISGVITTTGLTAGATYYASDTTGAISTTAGTTSRVIGVALSTTKLLMVPVNRQSITDGEKDALAGINNTPSTTNKFATKNDLSDPTVLSPTRQTFTASGTWTKPANLKYVEVEVVGGGGAGADTGISTDGTGGGGAGGYSKKLILSSALGATETVTIGASSKFGTIITANDGAGASYRTGGSGGTATGGDINIQGGRGDNGSAAISFGGRGGNSMFGQGGAAVMDNTNGNAGTGYGSGGSGAASNASGVNTGGAGASGIVTVTEYYM